MVNLETYTHHFVPSRTGSQNEDWTALLLHGTGGNEHDLIPLGQAIVPGAALLSPRGLINEGGSARFFRRLAEGVLDQDDLLFRTHELADWVNVAMTHYERDQGKVVAIGFSNGANIAASMLLRGLPIPGAAVLLSPMLPFVPEARPDLIGRSVFLGSGRYDPLVPVEQAEELESMLAAAGAMVDAYWFNGGHGLSQDELQAAQLWAQDLTGGPE
ncbi:MAG TPA: alpha/beta hydrolase [Thermomicrobiales bacterium]|nr:alpha/beta hydrolase [Thermomicrobiales bacterium]